MLLRMELWPCLLVGLLPGCIPPSTNIGLPARAGHFAASGSMGVQTDDVRYTSQRIERDESSELPDDYQERPVRVRHEFGSVQAVGAPLALGLRYGTSRYNDVGAALGWGHAQLDTRVDLLGPLSSLHLVVTADLRLTFHWNATASSRLFLYAPLGNLGWRAALVAGFGGSAGRFGTTTWHDRVVLDNIVPSSLRVERSELRGEAVLGLSLQADQLNRELVLFVIPYWVLSERDPNSHAAELDFQHERGAVLALGGTVGWAELR